MIRYLKAEEILILHALVIDATGGTHGVRDANLLASISERAKATFDSTELHTEFFTKAAVLCEGLVNYHVFVDGNKRTAFISLARFLVLNEYSITASNKEIEETMVAIAEKKLDIVGLEKWIKNHSEKYK